MEVQIIRRKLTPEESRAFRERERIREREREERDRAARRAAHMERVERWCDEYNAHMIAFHGDPTVTDADPDCAECNRIEVTAP